LQSPPARPQPRVSLSIAQRRLVRTALDGNARQVVTPAQRSTIRELCEQARMTSPHPEQFLIAFKGALVEAANELGTPIGLDGNVFLAQLVSVFIEEFYAASVTAEDARVVDIPVGVRKAPLESSSRYVRQNG
jgi:hypothetical protein